MKDTCNQKRTNGMWVEQVQATIALTEVDAAATVVAAVAAGDDSTGGGGGDISDMGGGGGEDWDEVEIWAPETAADTTGEVTAVDCGDEEDKGVMSQCSAPEPVSELTKLVMPAPTAELTAQVLALR